jgi:hypothetical protein
MDLDFGAVPFLLVCQPTLFLPLGWPFSLFFSSKFRKMAPRSHFWSKGDAKIVGIEQRSQCHVADVDCN